MPLGKLFFYERLYDDAGKLQVADRAQAIIRAREAGLGHEVR
jgi:hypothetical protein